MLIWFFAFGTVVSGVGFGASWALAVESASPARRMK
jgi:hypothetical protein